MKILSSPFMVILGQVIMDMYLFHSINSLKYKGNNSFVSVPLGFMAVK